MLGTPCPPTCGDSVGDRGVGGDFGDSVGGSGVNGGFVGDFGDSVGDFGDSVGSKPPFDEAATVGDSSMPSWLAVA